MKIGVRCAIIIFAVFALILPARLHARIVTRAHLLRRVVQGDRAGRQRVAAALRVVYFSSRAPISTTTLYGGDPPVEVRYDPLPPRPSRQHAFASSNAMAS